MDINKISNNLFKLSHSILISGLSGFYIWYPNGITKTLIFLISETYFTIDTIQLIESPKIEYPLIVHHMITMFYLLCIYIGYHSDLLINLYLMGELSNISIYTTYHLIKTSQNKDLIIVSNIFQFFWYSYFRIYCFTNILIKNYYIIFKYLSPLLLIYLMGFVWSFYLFKQIYVERFTILTRIKTHHDKLLQN